MATQLWSQLSSPTERALVTENRHVGNSQLWESQQVLQHNQGYNQYKNGSLRIKQRQKQTIWPPTWRAGPGEWLPVNGQSEGSTVLQHQGSKGSSMARTPIMGWLKSDRGRIWEEFKGFKESATMQWCSLKMWLGLTVQSPMLLIVFKTVIVAAWIRTLPSSLGQQMPEKQ